MKATKKIETMTIQIGESVRTVIWYIANLSETAKSNGWEAAFKKVIQFKGTTTTEFYYTDGEYDSAVKYTYRSRFKYAS